MMVRKFFQFVYLSFVVYALVWLVFMNVNVDEPENHQKIEEKPLTCGKFPEENDIFVDNLIWQVLETPRGFVKLLNAYLDTRFNMTIVRVNANSYELNIEKDSLFCQFWFEDGRGPYVAKATQYILMWFTGLSFKIYTKEDYLGTILKLKHISKI